MIKHRATVALIVTSIAAVVAIERGTNFVARSDQPSVKKYPTRNIPRTPQIVEGEVLVKYKEQGLPVKEPDRTVAINKAGLLLGPYFQHILR